MSKTFEPFDLYTYTDKTGATFLVPHELDMEMSAELIRKLDDQLLFAKSESAEKSLKAQIEYHKQSHDNLVKFAKDLMKSDKVKKHTVEISRVSYGELIKAQERATDWTDGMAKLNDRALSIRLLPNNVKLDGVTLDEKAIDEYDVPVVMEAIWVRMKSLLWPNQDRLPFLQAFSTD